MNGKYSSAIGSMIHTNRMHRRAIESIVEQTGIHHSQHRILMHLSHGGEHFSQKELAEHFGVSAAAITAAIVKLEREGYVERTAADGRKNEIKITDKGKNIVEHSERHFERIDEMLFDGFTDDEIELYRSFLDRMQMNASKILERKEK